MKIKGRAWKFGNDIDTDVIIPAKYLNTSEEKALAKNCFADHRPEFAREARVGDVIIAGRNFGCGSSREHAPLAIKGTGVRVIIAESFARIFYRNAFNIGLPLLESEEAVRALAEGDTVSVDLETGTIVNEKRGETYAANPIPSFMAELINAGGLVNYIKAKKIQR